MTDDDQAPETRRFNAIAEQSARFFVQYTKAASWEGAQFDDAITLVDARKVANARKILGFRTRIVESQTGTEII